MTIAKDFWSYAEPEPNSGCWIWTGVRVPGGYGGTTRGGVYQMAHRVAYELAVGPIPKGLYVLHRCDLPPCVNPAHLWVGTQTDNMRDCKRKGRIYRPGTRDETDARD